MFLFHLYESFVVRCHLPAAFVKHGISEFVPAPIIVSLVVIILVKRGKKGKAFPVTGHEGP
jgi:hypothetical protein